MSNIGISFVALGLGLLTVIGLYCKKWLRRSKNSGTSKVIQQHPRTVGKQPLPVDHSFGGLDYSVYILSATERFVAVVAACGVLYFIGFIFYKNLWISGFVSLAGLYYPVIRKKQLLEKRKLVLNEQFKLASLSLSSALSAGKSIENAFLETVKDLQLIYPDADTYIIAEFERINNKIRNGVTVEAAIQHLSDRAGLEDITNFSDVFVACKRSGGNLIEVVRRTAHMIGEKMEMKQEISVMIAQKKFESKVMSFAPLIVVAMLSFSSPDYMEPLYKGPVGFSIMTLCLLLLCFCYWITKKIMDIKV